MILGELKYFENLLPKEPKKANKLTQVIDLNKLEVIQAFHGSHIKNRHSIFTYGLIPRDKPTGQVIIYPPRIFVTVIYEEIPFDHIGQDDIDIWSFYIQKQSLHPDNFSEYGNHYYIKEPIPPHKLTLYETR